MDSEILWAILRKAYPDSNWLGMAFDFDKIYFPLLNHYFGQNIMIMKITNRHANRY